MNVTTWVIRWFSPKLIGMALIPALALAASDNGTLTVGKVATLLIPPSVWACKSGFESASTLGSYSPTGLTGGKAVSILEDVDAGSTSSCTNPVSALLSVTGFSSSPGQSWTTSVTCGGVSKTGASASYSYSGGTASWTWSSTFGFKAKPVGSNVSCMIVHN
jgi:hypothetical protein